MITTPNHTPAPGESAVFQGIGVSDGIVIGPARVLRSAIPKITERILRDEDEVAQETERFQRALQVTRSQLHQMIGEAKSKFGKEYSAILESHFLMLEDEEMVRGTVKLIKNNKLCAEAAFASVMDKFKETFLKSKNDYLRERAHDLEDVKKRLLGHLLGQSRSVILLDAPAIIIADTIRPGDLAFIERPKILGFVSEAGSKLSHFAIVARSMNLPAVTGITNLSNVITDGDTILVDGHTGEVILHPDEATVKRYTKKSREFEKQEAALGSLAGLPAQTTDGLEILLCANVELPEEVENAKHLGALGIGLYRTEYMLFSERELPDEETQYREYLKIAQSIHPHKLTMRTFDVGGDKIPLEILTAKGYVKEDNPFLGWRAIRIAVEYPDFFIPQVRAILRLSAQFRIEILIPMVISLSEIQTAKRMIEEAKSALRKDGVAFDEKIPVGMMIETPAAALLAEEFAKEVDFFSIGTNDLVQYTLATDRGNPKVAGLYNCFHPAVLQLLHRTIVAARKQNIHVAMCGEMASNPYATLLLLGMGLREFSVLPPMLPKLKKIIRTVSLKEAEQLAEKALALSDVAGIEALVAERTKAALKA